MNTLRVLPFLLLSACCGAVLHTHDRAYVPRGADGQPVEIIDDSAPSAVTPTADDPAAAFAALDQRLLAAEAIEIEFAIEAGAPYPAKLAGRVRLNARQETDLDAKGELNGQPAELFLQSGSGGLIGGDRASGKTFSLPSTPPALNESVIVGLLDMGLLHNLAVLAGGGAPDKSEGGVRAWVVTSNHVWDPGLDEDIAGRRGRALSFDVAVDGSDVADATLWLDSESGLPLKKRIVVRFEAGSFTNVETYARFDVTPKP